MLRTIQVYGRLAHFLGQRTFKAAINSPAEAIRFLIANFPGLEAHMNDQHYKVLINQTEISPESLHLPYRHVEPIKIVPVLMGAGATGKIIAGVALVALAVALAPTGGGFLGLGMAGTATEAALGTVASTLIGTVGASLALSGAAQLLTPIPRTTAFGKTTSDTELDPRKSYSFNGIQNTSRQGVPVPVIYGETLVGSIVISAFTNTFQVEA